APKENPMICRQDLSCDLIEVLRACGRRPSISSGAHRQRWRDVETKRLGGFEVEDCFVLGRRLNGKIGWDCAAQNTVNIGRRPAAVTHRKLIIALAARHRLPAVYAFRFMAADGGLISYGPDSIDPYRPQRPTLIASSRAKSPANFQFRHR